MGRRAKIVFFSLAPMVVLMVVLSITITMSVDNSVFRQFEQSALNQLSRTDDYWGGVVLAARSTSQYAARTNLLRNARGKVARTVDGHHRFPIESPSPTDEALFERFSMLLEANPDFAWVYAAWSDTGYAVSPPEQLPAGFDPTVRPFYTAAEEAADETVIVPYMTNHGYADLAVVTRICGENGEFIGIAAVDMTLERLSNIAREVRFGESGFLIVAFNDGTVLAEPKHPNRVFENIKDIGDYRTLANLKTGDRVNISVDGVPMIAIAYHGETGFTYYAIIEEAEIYGTSNALVTIVLITTLIVALLFSLIGWVASSRMKQDEIGELSESLAEMIARFREVVPREAVGRLAGGVAHDFNNLLTGILGYTELLLQDAPEFAREDLEEIQGAATRASELARQLLSFSRKKPVQAAIITPSDSIDTALRLMKRVVGEDIEIFYSKAPSCTILLDPHQMEQIIVNLILNARDAMPSGGALVIEEELTPLGEENPYELKPGNYFVLHVKDSGSGMDEETQRLIFTPYFTTKAHDKGTGLGLSSVIDIVKAAQGGIVCESTLGEGSTFSVAFPLTNEPAKSALLSKSQKLLIGKESVLLVEDEAIVRNLVGSMLERAGYQVFQASGLDESLEIQERENHSFDILVADVIMPNHNGLETFQKLCEQQQDLQVLFISGYPADSFATRGIEIGAFPFLQKPFTTSQLLKKMREILEKR